MGLAVDKMLSVVNHSWEPCLSGIFKIDQHLLGQWEQESWTMLEWNNNTSEKKKKKKKKPFSLETKNRGKCAESIRHKGSEI